MNTTDGIAVGDAAAGGLRINIEMSCASDASLPKEPSVVIDTGLLTDVDFEIADFMLTLDIASPTFVGTTTQSYIGELDYHNWDAELTSVLKVIAEDVNIRFGEGVDICDKWPKLNLAKKFIRNTLVSPFVENEFMFLGFKLITDI